MEINQKLFDECTQSYKAQRLKEKEALGKKDMMWSKIEELAFSNPKYEYVKKFSRYEKSIGGEDGINTTTDMIDVNNENIATGLQEV